ncbi:MAG TPA: aldehyde dehydrogenase family protein [Amycolatopsis sp.]|nr:aldehyde dehydrogenase family protein [Amycolatopsis sp.]
MWQETALIAGEEVRTGDQVEIEDPSTGEVFATTPDCGPAEIDRAVAAARQASVAWRRTAVADRAAVLRRLATLIIRDRERLGSLESRQTGKPLAQGLRDADLTARYFDFYASAVETFYGSTVPLNDGNFVFTQWEPHGVTAHVIPWNYPMQILGRSIAPALAVGNGTVLKPAEEAPMTALALARLALEAGLPAGLFNVVTGMGETAGAALTAHPGTDHISFTGSVEVGRIIGAAAAQRIVPVTMELGGKSPNIVFADADLDRAVPVIVNSIIQMGGQTCSAGSRLLVQRAVHDEVVARVAKLFTEITIGPALEDPQLGPLISGPQRARVMSYVERGTGDGTIVTGGQALQGGRYGNGFFVQPTLIDGVDPRSPLGQEEVFGPVLVVSGFDDLDDAVEVANGTDYGLVAGVWTRDVTTAHRMLTEIDAGQVFVNTYGASGGVELPFGGVKNSGHGREKGAEGLRGFARLKTGVIAR